MKNVKHVNQATERTKLGRLKAVGLAFVLTAIKSILGDLEHSDNHVHLIC